MSAIAQKRTLIYFLALILNGIKAALKENIIRNKITVPRKAFANSSWNIKWGIANTGTINTASNTFIYNFSPQFLQATPSIPKEFLRQKPNPGWLWQWGQLAVFILS